MLLAALSPGVILGVILGYFAVLILVSFFTNRGKTADNESFFLAGRKSPWFIVAFGMIGASLSGVTFISVPGWVGEVDKVSGHTQGFAYMQMVMGYMLGYATIALVLMPLYYRMGLTSIYEFLEQRLGWSAYKTGAFYFLVSRLIGSAFRLYLVAIVLQAFVFDPMGVPITVTVILTIALIWVYSFKGGIQTIIYTDTLQTVCMLLALVLTIIGIGQALDTDVIGSFNMVNNSRYSQIFFFEGGWADPYNFWKQFISGALITIVMTGLDQDMMQKNLSCRNIRDAQKNMFTFSAVLFVVKFLFLFMGAMLYIYANQMGIETPAQTDKLYPLLALEHLAPYIGLLFIIGLVAAAYSSADSALAALTTSFCVDFLNFKKRTDEEASQQRTRTLVHIGFSVLLVITILVFHALSNDAVIKMVFTAAGYTYGPLLGLFVFGMFTTLKLRERLPLPFLRFLPEGFRHVNLVMLVCLLAPVVSFFVDRYSADWLFGFKFGFLIIALNGFLTFLGLLAISYQDYEAMLAKDEAYSDYPH